LASGSEVENTVPEPQTVPCVSMMMVPYWVKSLALAIVAEAVSGE
jgi:hypothetical protein